MMPNHWRSAILAAVALVACEKPDQRSAYRDQLAELTPYYRTQLDGLVKRYDRIVARGQALKSAVPGADRAGTWLRQADRTIGELRGIVGTAPNRSPLDQQIEQIGGDQDALRTLYVRQSATLTADIDKVNERLSAVEDWLADAEVTIKAQPAPDERAMLAP